MRPLSKGLRGGLTWNDSEKSWWIEAFKGSIEGAMTLRLQHKLQALQVSGLLFATLCSVSELE